MPGIGDEKACLLIMIGVDQAGVKHFLAIGEGYRESKESWLGVMRDLRARGMNARRHWPSSMVCWAFGQRSRNCFC